MKEVKEEVKISVNKQKIQLLFPYSLNADIKKLGGKWDP